jgi:3-oxoacyl-[acyl-carrier protein] reductase
MIGSAVGECVLTPGLVPYSATKGAVKIFTHGLSREVGIRGTTIDNPLSAIGRYRRRPPQHSTATGTLMRSLRWWWRLSPVRESSYTTGANLTVDGGMNA